MIKREETRYGTGEEVSGSAFLRRRQTIVVAVLLPAMAWWSGPVTANPRGGSVVVGDVSIGSGAGGMLDIRQNSRNAIINWESFSIDAGEMTRFRQPGVNAAVLNRVTGGDPSAIHGALRANGNVFVINPNGILVGAGGTIDVHGLVLSTLDVDNGEFLAGGDMVLKGAGAGVTNMGRINAIGGDVFLIGRTVSNSGSISASEGTVGLAAGEEVLLKAGAADERIFVRAAGAGVSGNGIFNDGTISGAAVELKAHGNMYALAINNKGAIRATGAVSSGGRVHLQGTGGRVSNSGSIRASSTSAGAGASARILIEAAYAKVDGELRAAGSGIGGKVEVRATDLAEIGGKISTANSSGVGGSVDVEASRIVLESDSFIDVSGSGGGGQVRIGGGFQGGDAAFRNADEVAMEEGSVIIADSTESGPGGTVVLWSDGVTDFKGDISAQAIGSGRGGLVEVSGKEGLLVEGTVSTLAESGAHGILLLDPKNISISTAASSETNINTSTLGSLVLANHVVVSTLDAGTAQAGNISVLNTVRYNSANSLTLLAEGDLYIGDDVINQGAGNINLVAGWNPAVVPLGSLLTGTVTPHATLPGTATFTGGVDMDASVFSVPGAFGNAGGSVYVGSLGAPNVAADRAVAVGSRAGQTNVAGYDVNVWGAAFTGGINAGAQRYSQIGYNRRDAATTVSFPATGRIRIGAVNDVAVIANKYEVGIQGSSGWNATTDNSGNASFAQIGHGGDRDSARDMELSGEIIVEAGGDLTLLGGKAYNNHATIGHGGYDNRDTDLTRLASIGGGDITIDVGGNAMLQAGLGYHAHVQIGHGGGNLILSGFAESAITLTAGGDVTVRGGAGVAGAESNSRAQAQIGHGGYDADLISGGVSASPGSGLGYRGDITITADGSVRVESGDNDATNLAVIGNGGVAADGDHAGDITVTAGAGVELTGGMGSSTLFAQIGHVSHSSTNLISGDVSVTALDGGIRLLGGNSTANFAAIGSGGYLAGTGSTVGGKTTVISRGTDAGDGISLRSGDGTYAGAHIGHQMQLGSAGALTTLLGDINVEVAGGGLLMEASAAGYFSHVMIGHGGRDNSGSKSGNISVEVAAGDISVLAGGLNASSRYNHAQIGHGGYGNGISGSDITGSGVDQGIRLVAEDGNIVIRGGRNAYSYAMVGNGGVRAGTVGTFDQFGDISVKASGDITAAGGTTSYTFAQIGHGGPSVIANYVWNLGGAIEVEAGGSVTASGGSGSVSNSQIGHGGIATTTTSSIAASPISVKAITGDVHLLSGTVSSSGAKIGHGNYNQKLATFGESPVTVEAGRNVRLVSPQFATYTAVSNAGTQIGHGGFGATVGPLPSTLGYSGDITVSAGGKLDVIAGRNAGSYNWSLLGHTSYYNSTGIHSGDIIVTTGTLAGLSDYGVTVQGAYGDYLPLAGVNSTAGGYYSFASIGHRGHSNGPATYYTGLSGDILVDVVRGGVSVLGGDGVDGSTTADTPPDIRLHGAQIGHGGYAAGHPTEGIHGSVRVHAQEDILLRSGTSRNAAVMIGHGGFASFGPMGKVGDVLEVVSRGGSLELDSTLAINTNRGGVMIGHGAPSPGAGTRMGDILVDVAGEISMVGNLSYIGHRSSTASAISNADVTIRAAALDFTSGVSGGGLFQVGGTLGATLSSSLAGGNVSLVATGSDGLWLSQDIRQNSAFALNLLSQGNLYLTAHALNQGSGAVNLVAGWDPSVSSLSGGASTVPGAGGLPRQYWIRGIDMDAEIFGAAGSFGVGGGSVLVGANPALAGADRAVMAASRTGETNVAGSSVHVWGGAVTGGIDAGERRYSQIGYNRREAGTAATQGATGRIRVVAENDVEVVANKYAVGALGNGAWSGGNRTGFVSYAQIGHGGDREAVANMELTGEIVVEAGRDFVGLGGRARENYAMVGHGGYDNITSTTARVGGDIVVTVGNDLTMTGGQGLHAFAQIGHGGTRHPIRDFVASDITVTAGGDIAFTGGPGGAAGNSNGAYARIGHGGYDGATQIPGSGYSGDISVLADGSLAFLAGGGGAAYNYVQIGHGGFRSAGDHGGEICVVAGTGVVLGANASTGSFGYAQIGHGGDTSPGDLEGKVTVVAGTGGVSVSGGAGTGRYAQIGHGGSNAGGTLAGEIAVVADVGGDLSLTGGSTNSSYAMIGHGDGGGTTSGTREGGIRLFAGGALGATNGAGVSNTHLFHRSNGGLAGADYLGGNGFQVWARNGVSAPDSALAGINTMINGNIGSGPISLAFANDIDLVIDGPAFSLDNDDSFYLLTGGSITLLSGYQQAGTGSVTLVAGWDGSGATFADGSVSYDLGFCSPTITPGALAEFNTAGCDWFGNDAAGNGAGTLTIGSATQTGAVRVGTRGGNLVTAGQTVSFIAGSGNDAPTRIGFHPGAPGQGASGDLDVFVKSGGLLLQAGSGQRSEVQIGHGGAGSSDGVSHLGDISISFCESGDLSLLGGGASSYAQIGHGGISLNASHRGDIFIGGKVPGVQAGGILLRSGGANYAYTQIGHGGGNVAGTTYKGGNASGSVRIDAAGKVTVGAAGYGAYSQIGMGGLVNTNGTYGLAGDRIVVIAGNGIEVSGGSAAWSYAQIGNGGYQAGASGGTHRADIFLNYDPDTGEAAGGGEILVNSRTGTGTGALSATYAQIGHGGRNLRGARSGDIVIGRSDAITLNGSGAESYAQIGHGGNGSGAMATATGSIELNTGGLLQMNSGYGAESYTLVGHGGFGNGGTANYGLAGESISVNAGAVELNAGSALGAFSQIGHGGYRITGSKAADVVVTTLDGILLDAGSGTGEAAHVQIGHGGNQAGGSLSGIVSALGTGASSAVTLRGGDQLAQHAQIGHGGILSTGVKSGDVTVSAGSGGVGLFGGGTSSDAIINLNSQAQIGHGGSSSGGGAATGAISVTTTNGGDIVLRGGADRYTHAHIGHGGRSSTGNLLQSGAIEVKADGAVSLVASFDAAKPGGTTNGGAGETFAQIGHGGMFGGGTYAGDIDVTARTGISLRNGESAHNFSRIGHGGYDPGVGTNPATVITDADIRVATVSGGILLDAFQNQAHDWNLVQIGHGGVHLGTTRLGAYRGDISVDAGTGGVSVLAGRGRSSAAQIGHGGIGISGDHSGEVRVSGDGDLVMRTQALGLNANSDYRRYARIGHGGASSDPAIAMSGNLNGDICVTLGGSVLLDASLAQADASAVQIGHGGSAVKGNFDGKIVVVARGAGGVSLAGGIGAGTYAQIGHGGTDTDGLMTGHLYVVAETGDLSLSGGAGSSAYAMFGHGDGARSSLGQRGGGVHLFAQGDLVGSGGTGGAGAGNVFFFHQNNNGLQSADYLGGDGYQKVANGSITTPAYASADESTIINGNIGLGSIVIIDDSDRDYVIGGGDTFVNTSDDFYVVTGGSITMLASYQNAGSGAVTLVAGWNGVGTATPGSVTFNNGQLCDPVISNPGIGIDFNNCDTFGNGGASVVLGSAGQTSPVLVGSRGGTTTVAGYGLSLRGSDATANASTQLGFRTDGSGPVTGAIRAYLKEGGLALQSGNAAAAYAQIGHGGTGAIGTTVNAPITISFCEPGDVSLVTGNGVGAYAQIGHGGNAWLGDRGGEIRLEGLGGLSLASGTTDSYTQIGHGGAAVGAVFGSGAGTGAIHVDAADSVLLSAGRGVNAYAQIGHGGSRQVGHFEGAVTLLSGGSVEARGGTNDTTAVQIGHGGRNLTTAALSSIGPGDIRVEAAGDVLLHAGPGNYASTTIGHGNHISALSSFAESAVSVKAGRHIELRGHQFDVYTSRSYASAQIGHGGTRSGVGGGVSGYTGDITVEAGGKLDLIAARNAASYNYAYIGNGTYFQTSGVQSGDISVRTGLVEGLDAYGITIRAASGTAPGAINTSTSYYSFAGIGHRGHNPGNNFSGDILVDAVRGGISLTGGTGSVGTTLATTPPDMRLHPAQIGHGGFNITTTGVDGSIRVHAQGDILLAAENGPTSPVLIGHGGFGAKGPIGKEGDVIEVISREGNLELRSLGAVSGSTVYIGNGDAASGSGTRMGDILVDVAGEISLVQGGTPVWIGHRGNVVAGSADVTIRAAGFDDASGNSGSGLFRVNPAMGAMFASNLAGGDLSLVGTGARGMELNSPMLWTSPFDFNLLSYSDIFIVDDVINRGTGNINLFAGWDPSVASLGAGATAPYREYWIRDLDADSALFEVTGAYGNGDGSVWVGANADLSAADRSVAVGSRSGQTNVAGHDVKVWGAAFTGGTNLGQQRYSQIGYNRRDAGTSITDAVTGRVRVGALNNIEVIANKFEVGVQGSNGWLSTTDNTGNASFAQIGHGGERDSVRDMQLSGGIIVEAGGNLTLLGGIAYNNHASIGHGGYDNPDDDDGNNLATLGGDISVTVGGDLTLQAGRGFHAHVQIGHGGGGHYLADFTESDILVEAGGNVSVIGGAGFAGAENNSRSQAQIGHGGYNADFIADSTPGVVNNVIPVSAGSGRGYRGDITVDAGGSILVESGHNDAQNLAFIGNGGLLADGDHSGNITVTAGAGIDLRGGTGADALLAQIGHLAYASANAITGDVTVTARDGGIRLTGGGSTASYATIGSGGYEILQGSTIAGDTRVFSQGGDALDGIVMRSGAGSYASAHLGHLAQRGAGGIVHPVVGLSGDVEVTVAGGGLNMEASAAGYFSHVMIGHGGRDVSGEKSGDVRVTVDSGDITMTGGGANAADRYNHAQIGHGGYGNGVFGSYSGGIEVEATAGKIDLLGGQGGFNYALIGHGGSGAGDTSSLTLGGAIAVKALGDIALTGGTRSNATSQIGHGGRLYSIDLPVGRSAITSSPITVEAGGDVLVLAGSASYTPAKIGHGGTQLKLSSFGESSVDVTAGGNVRLVSPQFETYTSLSYSNTSIGHGGVYASVGDGLSGYSGDISVEAGGKIDVLASKNSATYNWSLIGHTSYYFTNSRGIHSGDISVTSGTSAGLSDYGLTVRAASGDFSSLPALSTTGSYYSFAAVGHRGHSGNTGLSGDISVNVVRGGIAIEGGNGIIGTTAADTPPDIRLHGAQIGHGGYNVSGPGMSGSVRVHAQSDIVLRSGTARHSPVLIGHGGFLSSGAMGLADDVIEVVSREGSLELNSTAAPTGAADGAGAYIGHGAPVLSAGVRQGDILVDVSGEISFVGTLPTWIGHRTSTSGGIANADVTIRARSTDTESGDSGGELFRVTPFLGSVLAPHLTAGHLSLVATGAAGLEVDGRLVGNSAFDLNLLSRSDIFILDDLLNQGTGDVNVFAGWNPALAPLYPVGEVLPTSAASPLFREYWIRDVDADTAFFGTAGSYGNHEAGVWIGASSTLAAADRSVAVGSRGGQTNVAGYDVNVWGSALTGGLNSGAGKYSQIGYNRADAGTTANSAVTGRIRVEALNDLSLEANRFSVGTTSPGVAFTGVDQTGFASFAKIGHGGERDTISGSLLSGGILVSAGGNLSALAGETFESFVQIGHGGHAPGSAGMQASGDIGVAVVGLIELSGGGGTRASALIGHGGDLVGGSRAGSIAVNAAGISLRSGAGAEAGTRIGHGGTGANGSSDGDITVSSVSQLLLQSGGESGSSSQIGHGGRQGSGTVAGRIGIEADGISLLGGTGFATLAQIGHGGYGFGGSVDGHDILVDSSGDLIMTGGAGKNANAQIGHGGFGASGLLFSGNATVEAAGIAITGGTGQFAYSQIGNLGGSINSVMAGDLTVLSGGDITIATVDGTASAYTKIGHGYDFTGSIAAINPVAGLAGDIRVGAFANLTLTDAMIGHLNAAGLAGMTAGETQIAVGMGDPTDPAAGTLVADSASEFSGVEGLRFYLAQRGNNLIAPGAYLNAVLFPGARLDPSDTQRYDEHVIHITGDEVLFPNEHGHVFGTGPAPSSPGNYAFYYDTISLIAGSGDFPNENPVAGGSPGGSGGDRPDPGIDPIITPDLTIDYSGFFTLDQAIEDWLRAREKAYSGFGSFEIYYENFEQYGSNGESAFEIGSPESN